MAHILQGLLHGPHTGVGQQGYEINQYSLHHLTRLPLRRSGALLNGSLLVHTARPRIQTSRRSQTALAVSIAPESSVQLIGRQSSVDDNGDDDLVQAVERESLQIVEWPAICKQVACFCGTSVAAELLARGQLPLGSSRAESELLLQQTAEALAAKLEVRGCFDIRPAVEAAASGACLTARQLQGVASTLEAALKLVAEVKATAAGPRPVAMAPGEGPSSRGSAGGPAGGSGRSQRLLYPTLAALAGDVGEEEHTLLRALQTCIKNGSVTDAASEALAAVRAERAANREALRAEVDRWYRALVSKGAVEPGGVRTVRGRTCLGVRAGRQGELPKGSVRLGASASGATLYVEPAPCVPLNNAEALLADREERATLEVLSLLSRMLGERRGVLLSLVEVFTRLDVVAARARHAEWLGGVRPAFVDESSDLLLHVPGALHPVLMQRGLPPLPQPPSVDDNRFDRDFQAAPAWERRRVLMPEGPASELAAAGASGGGGGGDGEAGASLLPKPLDLRVPAGKAVVAITGPNTGGKTVTLKAAGLMALMARAGLFLPCDPRVGDGGSGAGAGAGASQPRLAWFDRVLADIGDAQSLQQSLSTFSGHIRRIKQILAVAGPRSLVLLDEVGSGTDPLEGAALARAVLDRLAGQSRLTLATTHHAELKRAAEQDPRYVNVSMAFDTASLRPTYRLCWGSAGASNALDIAETLGFDRSVVLEARGIAAAMAAAASSSSSGGDEEYGGGGGGGVGWRQSHIAGVARSLVRQLEETRGELEATQARRRERLAYQQDVKGMMEKAQEMEAQLNLAIQEIVSERDSLAGEVQEALNAFASGLQQQGTVEAVLKRIEAEIPGEVAAYRGQRYAEGDGGAGDDGDVGSEAVMVGDYVNVTSRPEWGSGKVSAVKGEYVTVRYDSIILGLINKSRAHKFHKREVRKVLKSSSVVLPFGTTGLATMAAALTEFDTRVEGLLERDRSREAPSQKTAGASLARRDQPKDTHASTAGYASYADLVADIEPDLGSLEEDMEMDFGSSELNFLASDLDVEPRQRRGRDPSSGFGVREEEPVEDAEEGGQEGSSGRGVSGPSGRTNGMPSTSVGRAEVAISKFPGGSGSSEKGIGGGEAPGGGSVASAGGSAVGAATAASASARVFTPPPQTSDNTVDVTGEVPELAAADVEEFMQVMPTGSAFFVRHGTGTGAVREAVRAMLERNRRRAPGGRGRVLEWREAPGSRGEVTVVFL